MLTIKQKFHLKLPRLILPHRMKLSSAESEKDELIEAITTDTTSHDDDWQLSERPDTQELDEYWDKVEDDVRHDPEWKQISESDA